MLTIKYQSTFKKDYKKMMRRGADASRLAKVIQILADEDILPPRYRDHALSGDYAGCRECHIAPDWLLIYEIREEELILYLLRTGSHSDLF